MKGAQEKHGMRLDKLIKDEQLRESNAHHSDIVKRKLFESPLKQSISKLKVEPETATREDADRAHKQALEYVLRDGLMSRVRRAVHNRRSRS